MTLEEKKAALAAAQAALPLTEQLPEYIAILEEDIAAMESAAADQARDSPGFDWRPVLQLAGEVVIAAIKKHWPTASWVSLLSAAMGYLSSYLSK